MISCPNGCEKEPYGIEVRGVYDGVLIWKCPDCEQMWPRFEDGKRHVTALEIIELWETTLV